MIVQYVLKIQNVYQQNVDIIFAIDVTTRLKNGKLKNIETLEYFCKKCKNKGTIDFKYCYICGSRLMPDADHKSELWCPQCIMKITTIIK